MEERGVIPYKDLGQMSEGTAWDGPANVAAASVDDLKVMCAWYDSANADVKSSYKLQHHEQSGKKAVWRAVSAAMAALLGGRGGVQIPESDRKGVYNHLSKHYAEFEKEPPEFKSVRQMEQRTFSFEEVRVEPGGKNGKITGYAAVFNKPSEDLGGFREIIRPGAFSKTIKEADVRALFNHDPNFVLGRTKSGTLQLEENSKGLKISIDPPETQIVQDLVMSPIKRGDVDQMSFGFRTIRDNWSKQDESVQQRELLEVQLFDVSPVTFPAYPQTSVQARALKEEGIDTDLLLQVMIRAKDGILDDWDIAYLKRIAKTISGYIPSTPVPDDHLEENQNEPLPDRHSRDVLLKRLELAEKV